MQEHIMEKTYDVAVIGGGAAGIAAAIAAARNGAKTVLVESSSVLGGDLLSGLPIDGCLSSRGEWIVGGVAAELFDGCKKWGGYIGHLSDKRALWVVTVNPRVLGFVILEKLGKNGVDLLLYSHAFSVVKSGGAVTGVEVVNKQGTTLIKAHTFIDCTGDGDIACMAGADYEQGGPEGELQPVTMVFHMANIDPRRLLTFVRDHPENCGLGENKILGKSAAGLAQELYDQGIPKVFFVGSGPLMKKAIEDGEIYPCSIIAFTPNNPQYSEVCVNSTRITGVDGAQTDRLSGSVLELTRHVEKCASFLIKNVPGFENAQFCGVAPRLGVRETKRIVGDYVLSTDDILQGRKSQEGIGKGGHELDIHGAGTKHIREQIKDAGSYDIPYGCLLPKGPENLLIAGRCLSASREAHSSARVMGTCMAMGQAAGTAAALSVRKNITPRMVPVQELREVLRSQGAILDGTY